MGESASPKKKEREQRSAEGSVGRSVLFSHDAAGCAVPHGIGCYDCAHDTYMHCYQVFAMTKLFLTQLLVRGRVAPKIEKWKRRRSGIIVVSSIISSIPIGSLAYSATKRYVRDQFKALSSEMVDRKNNVEVLSLMPGFVATNMTKRIKS